jgi:hypothetical protein
VLPDPVPRGAERALARFGLRSGESPPIRSAEISTVGGNPSIPQTR